MWLRNLFARPLFGGLFLLLGGKAPLDDNLSQPSTLEIELLRLLNMVVCCCGMGLLPTQRYQRRGRHKLRRCRHDQKSDIAAEVGILDWADNRYQSFARPLIRMAKQWQRHRNVPIPFYQIERLVIDFLTQASEVQLQNHWWDWLLRDFFAYMRTRANGFIVMPGTGTYVLLGNAWLSRAETAHGRAIKACDYEADNEDCPSSDNLRQLAC